MGLGTARVMPPCFTGASHGGQGVDQGTLRVCWPGWRPKPPGGSPDACREQRTSRHQYRLDLGGTSMQRNNNPYVFLSSDDTSRGSVSEKNQPMARPPDLTTPDLSVMVAGRPLPRRLEKISPKFRFPRIGIPEASGHSAGRERCGRGGLLGLYLDGRVPGTCRGGLSGTGAGRPVGVLPGARRLPDGVESARGADAPPHYPN
ncbi:Hypp3848 [Branchiostoma lanceolatum]|uniref:Hypp3848 protein n=1 Tax=Branchiostoma lanceolatum TaxID=7740 RepID=A0A8K0A369_BRALA|nr:Hypp3848 [Branchiostoma lanceolatum]